MIQEKETYLANTRAIIEELESKGFSDTSAGAAKKQQQGEPEVESLLKASEAENVKLKAR